MIFSKIFKQERPNKYYKYKEDMAAFKRMLINQIEATKRVIIEAKENNYASTSFYLGELSALEQTLDALRHLEEMDGLELGEIKPDTVEERP